MSGLAITAFVLSLLVGGTAFVTGLWWLAALCAVFCVWAMLRALPDKFRGRGLAISGLVVSMLAGSCSYLSREAMFAFVDAEVAQVLRVLDASTLEVDERLERMDALLDAKVRAESQAKVLLDRYALVEERMGAWTRKMAKHGLFSSHMRVLTGPPVTFVRIDDPTQGPPTVSATMGYLWAKAEFERGPVFVGLALSGGFQDEFKKAQKSGRVLSEHILDVLFYAEESLLMERRAPPGASEPSSDK